MPIPFLELVHSSTCTRKGRTRKNSHPNIFRGNSEFGSAVVHGVNAEHTLSKIFGQIIDFSLDDLDFSGKTGP